MVAFTPTGRALVRLVGKSTFAKADQFCALVGSLFDTAAHEANAAVAAAAGTTLTAAQIAGQLITRSGATAAFTDTTDTAANIIAALPNAQVGQSFEATIVNATAFPQTLAAGAGVTLSGVTQIAPNCVGRFLITYAGPNAVSIYGLWVDDRGINNFTATTDPGVGNDNTQGYGPGSEWFNTTTNREWTCLSAATGAAVWSLGGVVPGVGVEPSSMLTQFGGGTASFPEEGNISRQISAAGIQPGATGADNVLAVFTLPASSLDQAGRGLTISAIGSFGATANTKTVKLIWNPSTAVVGSTVGAGGTVIATTGAVTTNGGGWQLSGNVFKYGAAGSNTQLVTSNGAIAGAAHLGTTSPALATATESGAILIAVTGNAATAVSDIALNWLEINAMN